MSEVTAYDEKQKNENIFATVLSIKTNRIFLYNTRISKGFFS
ncbi:hypothetical protein ACUIAK_12205 [Bacillus cytotoxicus]